MTLNRIAVLGAGIMGRGIAYAAALGGFRTTLQDSSAAALDRAQDEIHALIEKGVATGKVAGPDAAAARERLSVARKLEDAVREADLAIEAVPEDIQLKLEIFTALDRHAPPAAYLASNTSSLSITEMAAVTKRPERVMGMHFFNPVHRMKLLEVVRESPGFVTSRVNAMIGNEAFYMLQEGVASARDIDRALKLGLNHPMGPFELVDLVGLDTRLSILRFLHRTLGEKFRPCPLMEQYVAAGRLGRKVGRGVYEYEGRA